NDAAVWAERRDIRDAVRRQLLVPREPSALLASPAAAELRLDTIVKRYSFLGVDVIAVDGTTIASTSSEVLGARRRTRLDPPPFAAALAGTISRGLPFQEPVSGASGGRRPVLTLAAPVRDDGGTVLAVLAFRLDPGRGLTQTTQLGRVGETGET